MQLSLIPAPVDLAKTPTNLLSSRHPIHRWCNFIAGYSPELVTNAISEAQLSPADSILDPFAGLGTTLVQSLAEGYSTIGAEANPFFADIAKAKCEAVRGKFKPDEVFDRLHSLESRPDAANAPYTESALKFLNQLIPEESLKVLMKARACEAEISVKNRSLYRLVVSCLLERLAGSQTDGIYKAPGSKKTAHSYQEALGAVETMVRQDLTSTQTSSACTLISGSAFELEKQSPGSVSLCVTSPPYLNNFDYAEMTRMELYFWAYASSWSDITNRIRSLQVPNTTTVPADVKRKHRDQTRSLPAHVVSRLEPIVIELEEKRKQRAGKKEYYALVFPYFAALNRILANCKRLLRPDAPIHIVIGDAFLYGIHIPTAEVTRLLLEHHGFISLKMDLIRTRGARWILSKREGAGTPIGEFMIYGRRNRD